MTIHVCYVRKDDVRIHAASASVLLFRGHFYLNTNLVGGFYIRNKLNTTKYS